MTLEQKTPKVIVVSGDLTVDWHIANVNQEKAAPTSWSANLQTCTNWTVGGVEILANLVDALSSSLFPEGKTSFAVRKIELPDQSIQPTAKQFNHSYAIWSRFSNRDKERKSSAWRIQDFLGIDPCSKDADSEKKEIFRAVINEPEADLVILDDAGLGFREQPQLWPKSITSSKQHPWVILKMAHPVTSGSLWEHLQEYCSNRLVVIMTIDDLRRMEVQVSREISWERTAQDLLWELTYNPQINALSRCAFIVISFGPAGALMLSGQDAAEDKPGLQRNLRCKLFFDPRVIEGMWGHDYPGGVMGYTSCLTAGIVRRFMLSFDQPDIGEGILQGLGAMRKLHTEGYLNEDASGKRVKLSFPYQSIIEELANESPQFSVAEVPTPVRDFKKKTSDLTEAAKNGSWTILAHRYSGNLDQLAKQIVLKGPDSALNGVPLGKFGFLVTCDRVEIEAYQSIRRLVMEYFSNNSKKPLSVAVFGPPGAGKSFGVVQVANSIRPGEIAVKEFNLSQFGSSDDLLDALHQVRDIALSGKVPLVFWDEFDTPFQGKSLGWLRYFLSPMQDGSFQEGQIVHPIGRCIFVFAGGTAHEIASFGKDLPEKERREAKLPDFVSRLKGYLNVLGPNPMKRATNDNKSDKQHDPSFIIRRAILLRSVFERNAPQIFHMEKGIKTARIDSGVLRAVLKTSAYRHGVRSMETIITMSRLAGKTAFERSSLPHEKQLDLHVDAKDFLSIMQRLELEGEILEKLAEAVHKLFCDDLKTQGYKPGDKTDKNKKIHSSLRKYAELLDDEKEQNREQVRDIPNKLAQVGYVMMPARTSEPPFEFTDEDIELLATEEHERWMKLKIANGWRYDPQTDKENRLHSCLLPWDVGKEEQIQRSPEETQAIGKSDLPEDEKEKDRQAVRNIAAILARSGYTIVRR